MKKIIAFALALCVVMTSVAAVSTAAIKVKKASIKIDGKLKDWKKVKTQYKVTKNQNGFKLDYPWTMKVAWNGKTYMYVTATMKQPKGKIKNKAKYNQDNWWDDDAFELWILDKKPSNDAEYKKKAYHYAWNEKTNFYGKLKSGTMTKAKKSGWVHLKNNQWSVEASIKFPSAVYKKVKAKKAIYMNFGVEINSAGEFSLFKNAVGDFWLAKNLKQFKFVK